MECSKTVQNVELKEYGRKSHTQNKKNSLL